MDSSRRRLPVSLALPFSFLLFSFLQGCHNFPKHDNSIIPAYYFWRTNEPTDVEKDFLKRHRIQKLYVHLLDVDWSEVNGAVPVAENELQLTNSALYAFDSFPQELVPVVFITNKTFERIDSFDIPLLAKRLVRRCLPAYDEMDRDYELRHYFQNYEGAVSPKEIQFDCDWTLRTKGRYFNFLEEVKKILPSGVRVSATIRLHQFKYPSKTGVPPVDRGMLMVYNISDPKKYGTSNSIFDKDQAKAYFNADKKYPLPLDMVLPAWSWCIVYRNKQFYQVENELTEEELRQASFLQKTGDHVYSVTRDTVYKELFLRPGDEIKAESIDQNSLREAVRLSQKAVNSDSFTVSLFELSEKEFQHYSHEDIDQVYAAFR